MQPDAARAEGRPLTNSSRCPDGTKPSLDRAATGRGRWVTSVNVASARRHLELTRFGGALQAFERRLRDAENTTDRRDQFGLVGGSARDLPAGFALPAKMSRAKAEGQADEPRTRDFRRVEIPPTPNRDCHSDSGPDRVVIGPVQWMGAR